MVIIPTGMVIIPTGTVIIPIGTVIIPIRTVIILARIVIIPIENNVLKSINYRFPLRNVTIKFHEIHFSYLNF
jgi:hypothetical protein